MMPQFRDSKSYWEERYKNNGTSGAGSYGRLANFKANVINDFIKEVEIKSVIEFGCGDGNQLSLLDVEKYIGFDVSDTAIKMCQERFMLDNSKTFYHIRDYNNHLAELTLSLDVIYHLIEDPVYELYMKRLFSAATRYVIIYSSNVEKQSSTEHVKHRKFTDWIGINAKEWQCISVVKNQYPAASFESNKGSFANFYIFRKEL